MSKVKKASVCKVCNAPLSSYIMNNKAVCLRCDDLLFDIEIECDDLRASQPSRTEMSVEPKNGTKAEAGTKK